MVRGAWLAFLVACALLAGCASPPPEADPAPGDPAAPSGQEGLTHATVNDTAPANGSAPAAPNRTFPRQEHDVTAQLYARGPNNVTAGNMNDLSWQVDVPAGAAMVRATADNVSALVAIGEIRLMIHVGALGEGGPMIAAGNRTGDVLATELVPLPPGTRSLVLMCHVEGEPVAAEVSGSAHLAVEFL